MMGLLDRILKPVPQIEPGILDVPELRNSHGGSFATGILEGLGSALAHPGNVYAGRADPYDPEQAANIALSMMGGGVVAGGPKGAVGSGPIRAYHGSPHDFDRFDLSKIGTGEGAQAYGHGLYFAEAEDVAKSYRDGLSRGGVAVDGKRYMSGLEASDAMDAAGKLPQAVRDEVRWYINRGYTVEDALKDIRKRDTKGAQALEKAIAEGHIADAPVKGSMYEVAIKADPDRFLDWDKPLYKQPEPVKQALEGLGIKAEPTARWTVEPTKNGDKWVLRNVWGENAGIFKSREAAEAKAAANTDRHHEGSVGLVYQQLGGNHIYSGMDKGEASRKLREAGIPGIKYKDAGSRGADGNTGTRNYVVFDDSVVEIIRKYGIAGLALLPPAVAAQVQAHMEAGGEL